MFEFRIEAAMQEVQSANIQDSPESAGSFPTTAARMESNICIYISPTYPARIT